MSLPTKQRRSTRKPSKRGLFIRAVQQDSIECIQSIADLSLPRFGPVLGSLRGTDLDDAVISHRILSKFEEPDQLTSKNRRNKSISDCIEYDLEGKTSFTPADLSEDSREVFWNARFKCYKTFKDFRPSYKFAPPTGESSLSSAGDGTDVMQKLQHLRYWEVSPDALPYAIRVVYHNRWLRKIVKTLFDQHSERLHGQPASLRKQNWYNSYTGDRRYAGLHVVGKMFASLCTLSAVSRMTTVPKNNASDRVITCEPFWDMVCQLSMMTDIRVIMHETYGFDLTSRAELHKMLIKDRRFATIDLKNASNSVWMCVVSRFFHGDFLKYLRQLRNAHTSYDTGEGMEYHHFNMFSPMGCGLTFDVMTLLLWFIAQELDPLSSVFGDDIMIHSEHALRYQGLLQELGMQINVDKTFVDGMFSESCGGFYNHSVSRYVVSYDIHWPTTVEECFILINKIGNILYLGHHGIKLKTILFRWHQKLVSLCAPHVVRSLGEIFYIPHHTTIPDGFVLVWSNRQVSDRKPSNCVYSREMTKDLQRQVILASQHMRRPVEISDDFDETVRLASWFHACMEYKPTRGFKEVSLPHDIATGTPTKGYQFVSILA